MRKIITSILIVLLAATMCSAQIETSPRIMSSRTEIARQIHDSLATHEFLGGAGSIAYQDSDAVNIVGGNVDPDTLILPMDGTPWKNGQLTYSSSYLKLYNSGIYTFPNTSFLALNYLTIAALTDTLNKYRTSYKLDTTAIDTSQWHEIIRDWSDGAAASDSSWWSAQVGTGNTVDDSSFAIGENNIASDNSIAIGHNNIARHNGLAIGYVNWVYNHEFPGDNGGSLAVGWADTVTSASCFIAGNENYIRVDAFGDTANSGASGIIGNMNSNYGASSLVIGEDNQNAFGALADPTIKDQDGTASLVVGTRVVSRAANSIVSGIENNAGLSVEGGFFSGIMGGMSSDASGYSNIVVGNNLTVDANYSAVFGKSNEVHGGPSLTSGQENYNKGAALVVGEYNTADSAGIGNYILGDYNHIKNVYRHSYIIGDNDTTEAWYAFLMGRYLKSGWTRTILMGHGLTDGTPMVMPDDYAFGVGFKSTIPTLIVTEAGDAADSWGSVGIGDNTPDARFEVDNGGILASDSLSVGGGIWMRNMYQSGNDLGIIFYNSALSRIDTVFAKQP